jgi:arylsulfatase A
MRFLKLYAGFILLLLWLSVFPAMGQKTSRPNIIIIYADDMGYGDLAVQNPESKIPTPYLDRLASEGMRFTDAHSSSGVCSPSRFALLTGMYHWRRRHEIIRAFGTPDFFESSDVTIAEMLRNEGYQTAMIGKWHLGWEWDEIRIREGNNRDPGIYDWSKPIPGGPVDRGFDYYFGDGTINFPPYTWIENDRFLEPPLYELDLQGRETREGRWEFRDGPMAKDWNPYDVLPTMTEKAVEYINSRTSETPFFFYFSLPSPHAPIIPNEEFWGKSGAGGYGDFVYQTDWVSGQVLEALKENGLDENTIVIFTSDNGAERYAWERARKYGHFSSGKLRGLKRDVWEGGHRVPFIIRWPGMIEPGSVSDEVISQVDLKATFASIAGYRLSDDEAHDSYDLTPVFLGREYDHPLREATIHNTFEDKFAIRKGKWLFINNSSGEQFESPDWYDELRGYETFDTDGLLFDMSVDPGQRNNLYSEFPEVAVELENLLHQYRNSTRTVNHR